MGRRKEEEVDKGLRDDGGSGVHQKDWDLGEKRILRQFCSVMCGVTPS